MLATIEKATQAGLFRCPDDRAALVWAGSGPACTLCGRMFLVFGDRIVDLRPLEPTDISGMSVPSYAAGYLESFGEDFNPASDRLAPAWGAEETVSAAWLRKRQRQVAWSLPLVMTGQTPPAVVCDLSGGAGWYSLRYAGAVDTVIHCDLSPASLRYVNRKAMDQGIENMLFVRADYFRPPFSSSIPCVVCFDTLIRGEGHDTLVLRSVLSSLSPSGWAVVDFHNWWHNPVRRLGLLPQNFGDNRSYSRRKAERILRRAGAVEFSYHPFFGEVHTGTRSERLLRAVVPATRHGFVVDPPAIL